MGVATVPPSDVEMLGSRASRASCPGCERSNWGGRTVKGPSKSSCARTSTPPGLVHALVQVLGPTLSTEDRQDWSVSIPHQVKEEGLRPRFRGSEALSRTWWQVKDSNPRSFRDGSTVQRRQARDQRKRTVHRQLTCAFPTDTRRQPTAAGHFGDEFIIHYRGGVRHGRRSGLTNGARHCAIERRSACRSAA